MVECQLPKLVVWVRFPLPAPNKEKGHKSPLFFAMKLNLAVQKYHVPSVKSGSYIQKSDIANANVIFTVAKMCVQFYNIWKWRIISLINIGKNKNSYRFLCYYVRIQM